MRNSENEVEFLKRRLIHLTNVVRDLIKYIEMMHSHYNV